MVELGAGVDVGDDDALTAVAQLVPDAGRVHAVDVPLDRLHALRRGGGAYLGLGLAGDRLGQGDRADRVDAVDLGQARDLGGELLARGHFDGVDDPEGGVLGVVRVEQLAQLLLRGLRAGALDVEDQLGLGLLRDGPAGAAQIGAPLHPDPEGGLVVLRELGLDGRVDLSRVRRGVRRGLRG